MTHKYANHANYASHIGLTVRVLVNSRHCSYMCISLLFWYGKYSILAG